MAKSAAAMVTVGEREVRVSSPDRVVYEATYSHTSSLVICGVRSVAS